MATKSHKKARKEKSHHAIFFSCLFVFFVAILACPVHAVVAADDYVTSRAKLDAAFDEKLDSLATKCEELGLKEQAAITRAWIIPRHPGRQYLFLPEAKDLLAPKADAPDVEQKWYAKLMEHRRAQAAALFERAQAELKAGRAPRAYQLLHEALREDPDHAEARRILGYRKLPAGWLLAGSTSPPTPGRRAHPKYGWGANKHWRHETPHFSIATSAGPKQATDLGQKLEELHSLWRQAFFSFWTNQPALAHRFSGGNQPLVKEPKKLNVVLFKDRAEYVAVLEPGEPKIGLTTGIYLDKQETVFLYGGDEKLIPTWYHEATHQLFQEIDRFPEGPGSQANFWLVEGAAMYMESLQRHEISEGAAGSPSYWTLGGWESDRLQFARYRGLSGDFLLPLKKLSAMGRADIQASSDIRKMYGQSAGMAHYLMDAADGEHREEAVGFLRSIYDGRQTAPPQIPQAAYLEYLQVTDDDLAHLLSPQRVRNLSLGRTNVTDQGLAHLAACKDLEWLDLSLTKTSDAGLAAVRDCTSLSQLFLEGTKITGESLQLIGKLQNLEELDLSTTPITDDGLAALSGLKKLRILYLTNSPISDAGLAHLKGLASLEVLETTGTKVTSEGLAQLRGVLPKLKKPD